MDKTKQNVATALTKLANDPAGKSQAARIRGVMPYIESALASGVSRQSVLDALRDELNITMGMKSFEKALQRIRKERKKKGVVSGNADNPPVLTGGLVVYTHEPANEQATEVLEGELVKQEEWEDDELGDANEVVKKNMWVELDEFGDKVFNAMPKTRVLITREEREKRRNGE